MKIQIALFPKSSRAFGQGILELLAKPSTIGVEHIVIIRTWSHDATGSTTDDRDLNIIAICRALNPLSVGGRQILDLRPTSRTLTVEN
jgi:hypothetical protein